MTGDTLFNHDHTIPGTRLLDEFDEAWSDGAPIPQLTDFLNRLPDGCPSEIAWELIAIDLEYRWRCWGRDNTPDAERCGLKACPRIDDYLECLPDCLDGTTLPTELIAEEYRVRSRWGPVPTHEEFRGRFRKRFDELAPFLAKIDQENTAYVSTMHFGASSTNPTDIETALENEFTVESERPDLRSKPVAPSEFQRIGSYEIVEEIARGGMGVVFRARQPLLDRTVALKMILGGPLADAEAIRRFHSEAEAAAQLEHPHIVPIFEVGEHAGQPFFSMAFVEGDSLRDRIAEGPVSPGVAAEILEQVAHAVEYAHGKKIVHRDLKPGNILIGRDGQPRVTDFGLAKRVEADSSQTATGQIMGTPSYMSPEQATGQTANIGPAADIYALGAVLYAMLTGRPPFQAASLTETIEQVVRQPPISLRQLNPTIPRDLETICLKCLEKERPRRYASAEELAEDLRRYRNHEPIHARPIGVTGRFTRWCRRNPGIAGLTATVLSLLVAVLIILAVGNVRVRSALAGEREALGNERIASERERTQRQRAREALRDSLVREAEALWVSRERGWRPQALDALRRAAEIEPGDDLRELGLRLLASPDWVTLGTAELDQPGRHLAIAPGTDRFAIATGSQIFLGKIDEDGEIVEPSEPIFSTTDDHRITDLIALPGTDEWVWTTDDGQVVIAEGDTEARVIRSADGTRINSIAAGPGADHLTWTTARGRMHFNQDSEATVEYDLPTFAPDAVMQNNPEVIDNPAVRDDSALVADPLGEFVIESGTLRQPTLFFRDDEQSEWLTSLSFIDDVPTGANLHLAIDPTGRYLYVACNEPRWGENQIGGRLPPWADDWSGGGGRTEPPAEQENIDPPAPRGDASEAASRPQFPPFRTEPPPPNFPNLSGKTAFGPGVFSGTPAAGTPNVFDRGGVPRFGPRNPFESPASGRPNQSPNRQPFPPIFSNQTPSGPVPQPNFSVLPFPPEDTPDSESPRLVNQQGAGVDGGSKEPVPTAGGSRGAFVPQPGPNGPQPGSPTDSSADTRIRPLNPILSGPVRRGYLFQFEIVRNPEAPVKERFALLRIDPRDPSEFHIARIGDITGLTVSADGHVLLAGSTGEARLFRPDPPRLRQIATITVPNPPLRAVGFLGDGNRTAICAGQRTFAIWERRGTRGVQTLRAGLPDTAGGTHWAKIAVCPRANRFAVATWGQRVEVHDLTTGKLLREIDEPFVRELVWAPDGSHLDMLTPLDPAALELSPFKRVLRWRHRFPINGKFVEIFEEIQTDRSVAALHSLDDRTTLIGLRRNGLDWLTGRSDQAVPEFLDEAEITPVCVTSDPTGDRIAAAASDGTVRFWSGTDRETTGGLCLNGPRERWVNDLVLRPGSSGIEPGEAVAATTDHRLVLLTDRGQIVDEWETEAEALAIEFDRSGTYLLVGNRDGSLIVWHRPTQTRLIRLQAHSTPVGFVGFEPGGTLLSAGLNGEVKRWRLPILKSGLEPLGIDSPSEPATDWTADSIPTPREQNGIAVGVFGANGVFNPPPRPE